MTKRVWAISRLLLLTATAGDRQRTRAGQPFPRRLAVKLTDEAGNPIPRASISFNVTSGEASFPALDVGLMDAVDGYQALAQPPRTIVTVPTAADGIATAPELTAGKHAAEVVVTASPKARRAVKQVFALSTRR